MLKFHLSKTLSKDLSMHLAEPLTDSNAAMQWYAHRVTVLRRKCIIAMELQSRYCMVFCGLTKKEFAAFPDTFQEQLWREAVTVCQLDELQADKLAAPIHIIGDEQHYQSGSDRSVQAHINDVAWHLKDMAEEIGFLPESPEDAFGFGVKVNELLRICKGDKDYFRPIDEFRGFWLEMLDEVELLKAETEELAPATTLPGNVLPFRQKIKS